MSIELGKYLTRYWFEFEPTTKPTRWSSFGCGVTALDYDDAVRLLRERVFKGHELPPITRCVENVDVRTLDRDHVLPNMGVVIFRGVWWPHRDWVENHRF